MTISVPENAHWSVPQKIAFRFFFAFLLLSAALGGNDELPFYSENLLYPFMNWFEGFIIWAAKTLLNVEVPRVVLSFAEGGGDRMFDYMLYLFIIVLSAVITIIWSYSGRKTANYNKLLYWLLVILRYYVATTMIFFGLSKPFRTQFPYLTISRLMERVGDMSPMGLVWTYMSYSPAFNYLIGFAELLCAGLLFFRRTAKLGATIGVVLMINIVAINFCFDVCVKISSTMILLTCLFILIPHLRRFIDFFIRNREVPPSDLTPQRFKTRWKNMAMDGFKYVLIVYVFCWNYNIMSSYGSINNYAAPGAAKPPLYGLYKIDTFIKNRDTLQPLTTDTLRWNNFWIGRPGYATIKLMNDSIKVYQFKPDTLKHTITANTYTDTLHKFYLNYSFQKPNILVLHGQWKKDSVYIRMHQVDINSFRLISRGFHMVNEVAYNR